MSCPLAISTTVRSGSRPRRAATRSRFCAARATNRYPATSPNLEYLICRHMRRSVLKGRGKVSVLPQSVRIEPSDDLEADLTKLCVDIENAWRRQLGPQYRARELTVSWREYWLGHWTLPLD
jgi:hypothetical protein